MKLSKLYQIIQEEINEIKDEMILTLQIILDKLKRY